MQIDRKCSRTANVKKANIRCVPAFTYQSLQKNTVVIPPPRSYPYKIRPVNNTFFRLYMERGDIPIRLALPSKDKEANKEKADVTWLINPKELDYCYYLPIMIDGLAESDESVRDLAFKGSIDLINRGKDKVLPALPQLILPFKKAFNTRDGKIIVASLKVIQNIVLHCPCAGVALVPYYRQLLPICNMFKDFNVNLGDGIDSERHNRLGDVIEDTLQILEQCGGPDAYINIKYMVPTYESCVMN